MTASVELEDAEWQMVITALAMGNPLVVKIAQQLQRPARSAEEEDRRQAFMHPVNSGERPS